ncbi:MAG TPA: tetratricopeptide repeat protein [Vicinamibacterales bacterium]|jgi:tetratricopeptide (TPR) repeat protein
MTCRTRSLSLVAAAALALTACNTDPHARAAAAMQKGDAYRAQQKYPEAAIEYRRAIQSEPARADAHARLAEVYLAAGEPLKAYPEFVRATDLDSNNLDAEVKAGNILLMMGRFEDASHRADLVLSRDPRNVAAYILRGTALAGLNEPGRAVREMEQALAIDPENAAAYTALGRAQWASGRRDAAAQSLDRAVALAPSSVDARLSRANFLWAAGDKAAAERDLLGALALGGNTDLAHRALALFYLESGRAAEAEPHFRALAGTPDGALALVDYYTGVGRLDAALQTAQTVHAPPRAERGARIRIAAIRQRQGKKAEALAIADGLLKDDAHDVEARLLRARLLLASGQGDAAAQEAGRAAADDPSSASAAYTVGLAALQRHDAPGAEAAFEKTLSLNPRASAAQMQLARLRLARGDADGAVRAAESAAAARRGDPDATVLFARALRASGDVERARRELSALPSRAPQVEVERAMTEVAAGHLADARAIVLRALNSSPRDESVRAAVLAVDLAGGDLAGARRRVAAWLAAGDDASTEVLAARVDLAAHDDASAERRLLQTVQTAPDRADVYELLAQIATRQGNIGAAVSRYRDAAARVPDPTGPATLAGILLEAGHDTAGARAQYEAVLARDPHAGIAANNLAWLLADAGDLDRAARLAQVAVDSLHGRPEAHDTLGYVYLKMGRASDAAAAFAWALSLAPGNTTYKAHAAQAHAALGR